MNYIDDFVLSVRFTVYYWTCGFVFLVALTFNCIGFGALHNRDVKAKEITMNQFKSIINSKGHYVGFFGQCPYRKDDRYYVPCGTLLTDEQRKEFQSSVTFK